MSKKGIISYLQSIIAIPMIAVTLPLSGVSIQDMTANSLLLQENSAITAQEEVEQKEQALKIDKYFESRGLPLAGYGKKFVEEAVKNEIDPFLLPAIAMRESTGGKQACRGASNSVFGYGSCRMGFDSIDESIEIVAKSLGGNNPKTARHYDGKTTEQILKAYNSYITNYSSQVMKIMDSIENTEI